MPPFASVVIPAFNEARRLPRYLAELTRLALDREATPVELVVVDDGSDPEHVAAHRASVAEAAGLLAAAGSPHVLRFVESGANGGKGAAIRRGWAEADSGAEWLGFVDADGAVPAAELWRLVEGCREVPADVVAGSRILMAGRRIERSLWRHLQGRVFATLAEQMLGLGFYDTQCGFKLVRGSLLRPHLSALAESGWLLDVELLALLRRLGARMREEPIDWCDPGGSKVRVGVDALRMLIGLRRVRRGVEARLAAASPSPAPAEVLQLAAFSADAPQSDG